MNLIEKNIAENKIIKNIKIFNKNNQFEVFLNEKFKKNEKKK